MGKLTKAILGGLIFVFLDYLSHTLILEEVFPYYYPETVTYYLQKLAVFLVAYYLVFLAKGYYTALHRKVKVDKQWAFALTAATGMSLVYGFRNLYGGYPFLGPVFSASMWVVHFVVAMVTIVMIED